MFSKCNISIQNACHEKCDISWPFFNRNTIITTTCEKLRAKTEIQEERRDQDTTQAAKVVSREYVIFH